MIDGIESMIPPNIQERASVFRFYSVGTVAANKPLSSFVIEVVPQEDSPMIDGELTDNGQSTRVKTTDADGAARESVSNTSLALSATWLPIGSSNRRTAPDVRRGETVMIYQFGNQDKYFWTTLTDDSRLRKLETVIWGFSATADENAEPSPDNFYYLEISTHTKMITFHTTKANGEPFMYDFQLNTGEGTFLMTDDAGNFHMLDSNQNQWKQQTGNGAYMEAIKEDLNFFAPKRISMKCEDFSLDADKTASHSAGESITSETKIINNKADESNNDTPIFKISGNLFMSPGRNGSSGSGKVEGNLDMDGFLHVTGEVTSDTKMTAPVVEGTVQVIGPNIP